MERSIYAPLGMTRTSSRFSDFATRSNRVVGHRQVNGKWVPVEPPRMPDAQAPAASVTSSVNDMARWLAMLLGKGMFQGRRIVDAAAITAAFSPQMLANPAHDGRPAEYYGFGFNVGTTPYGLMFYAGTNAIFTNNNWYGNQIDVDVTQGSGVSGDFTGSWFDGAPPVAKAGTQLNGLDALSNTKLADAGPR